MCDAVRESRHASSSGRSDRSHTKSTWYRRSTTNTTEYGIRNSIEREPKRARSIHLITQIRKPKERLAIRGNSIKHEETPQVHRQSDQQCTVSCGELINSTLRSTVVSVFSIPPSTPWTPGFDCMQNQGRSCQNWRQF